MAAVIMALANQKGGVGKTATTVNLAGVYQRKGLRTLVVDLDPQCHSTELLLHDSPPASKSLAAIFEEAPEFNASIIKSTRLTGLSVAPSCYDLAAITMEVYGRFDALRRLSAFFRHADVDKNFDVVLIDCPPDLGIYTLNAISAARWIITPCQPEAPAITGFGFLATKIKTTQSFGVNVEHLGVIITMYDQRVSSQKEWVSNIMKTFDRRVLGQIHRAAQINDAVDKGKLLSEVDRRARPYREHVKVAHEIAIRTGIPWLEDPTEDAENDSETGES